MSDIIRIYLALQKESNSADYITAAFHDAQLLSSSNRVEDNINIVQQLLFFDLLGFDTSWAHFIVVDVMALDDFSAKRVAYTAAAQFWSSTSDAALMATNRISRDLTSISSVLTSSVLSSIPTYLNASLASALAPTVTSLMSSVHVAIRQKAIIAFYHICLHSPDSIKPGIQVLRARLDDPERAVVFSALSVIAELCGHSARSFVPLIPKLAKLLDASPGNWALVKLVTALRLLCAAEPRLPKKLAAPFASLIETTSSATVLFDVVRSVVDIPLAHAPLLASAAQRMAAFLEHRDATLSFLGLGLLMRLLRLQPRLVAPHRELITQCLDSGDEATRLLALDLLASVATARSVDAIVDRLLRSFRRARSCAFRNQLAATVVAICSRGDYALVHDFAWYVAVLCDLGGATCLDLLADQFLDLAQRVPAARARLVAELPRFLARDDCPARLLLVAAHVIGAHGGRAQLAAVAAPAVARFPERVQVCCLSAALKIFLRARGERADVGRQLRDALARFATSRHAEVQDSASVTAVVVGLLMQPGMEDALEDLVARMCPADADGDGAELPEIARPRDLDLPVDLFDAAPLEPAGADVNVIHLDLEYVPQAVQRRRRAPKQAVGATRAVVLKTTGVLGRSEERAKTRAIGGLSSRLAVVDLAETVAAVEAQRAAPVRTDASLRAKQQAEAAKAVEKGRKRRKRQGEAAKRPEIEGPVSGWRQQTLCESEALVITAAEFTPDRPNVLAVDLFVKNKTKQSVGPIRVTRVGVEELAGIGEVAANSSQTATVALPIENVLSPKLVKLRFVAPGFDPLEGDLRVFPSFFLVAAQGDGLEEAREQVVHQRQIDLSNKGDGRAVLQLVVNVLRGTVLAGDGRQSKVVFARAVDGSPVIATIEIQKDRVLTTVGTSDEGLLAILIKELQRKK